MSEMLLYPYILSRTSNSLSMMVSYGTHVSFPNYPEKILPDFRYRQTTDKNILLYRGAYSTLLNIPTRDWFITKFTKIMTPQEQIEYPNTWDGSYLTNNGDIIGIKHYLYFRSEEDAMFYRLMS